MRPSQAQAPPNFYVSTMVHAAEVFNLLRERAGGSRGLRTVSFLNKTNLGNR